MSPIKLDPNRTWTLVEARLARETDPRRHRSLELVLAHMQAEARGDIEGVVATLTENPHYITHSRPDDEALNPRTDKDAVRAFYDRTIVQTGAHRLEFTCDRVIVDDDAVFTEGRMRMAYPGRTLVAMGVDVPDPDGYYLTESRMGIVWPVDPDTGYLTGEEVYTGVDGFAGIAERPVSLEEIAALAEG